MTSWSRLAGVLALGASLSAIQGQAPGTEGQKPPAFKSGVDLVAVDVNVVDRNGQPVAGLAAEQFELSVDGKPRRVVSATFLDYASAKTVPEAAPEQPVRIDRGIARSVSAACKDGIRIRSRMRWARRQCRSVRTRWGWPPK